MIKKLTPVILALIFICQACYSTVWGSVTTHQVKVAVKFEQSSSDKTPGHLELVCENEELDEDEIQHLPIIAILNPEGYSFAPNFFVREHDSGIVRIVPRIHSSVRAFTCIFII